MYVYLPVQFIFSFCSNYCLLTFCIFLNIFLDLLYILCHAVFLAIKTNKKKKKKRETSEILSVSASHTLEGSQGLCNPTSCKFFSCVAQKRLCVQCTGYRILVCMIFFKLVIIA